MMKSIENDQKSSSKWSKPKKMEKLEKFWEDHTRKEKNKKSRLRAFARTQVKNYSIDLALIIKWEKTEFWSYEIAEITIK